MVISFTMVITVVLTVVFICIAVLISCLIGIWFFRIVVSSNYWILYRKKIKKWSFDCMVWWNLLIDLQAPLFFKKNNLFLISQRSSLIGYNCLLVNSFVKVPGSCSSAPANLPRPYPWPTWEKARKAPCLPFLLT